LLHPFSSSVCTRVPRCTIAILTYLSIFVTNSAAIFSVGLKINKFSTLCAKVSFPTQGSPRWKVSHK
jgi:hypothetical protein